MGQIVKIPYNIQHIAIINRLRSGVGFLFRWRANCALRLNVFDVGDVFIVTRQERQPSFFVLLHQLIRVLGSVRQTPSQRNRQSGLRIQRVVRNGQHRIVDCLTRNPFYFWWELLRIQSQLTQLDRTSFRENHVATLPRQNPLRFLGKTMVFAGIGWHKIHHKRHKHEPSKARGSYSTMRPEYSHRLKL